MTGVFRGQGTFGEGENQVTLTAMGEVSEFGVSDCFLAKYVPVETPSGEKETPE